MTCGRESRLTLRRATEADSDLLFDWRNAPEVRRWSFQKDVIPAEAHRKWFLDALRNERRHILIAETQGTPVGVVRIDREETSAEVHVYLGPDFAGRGLGTEAIQMGCDWAREHLGIERFIANVEIDNAASLGAFEKAGFKTVSVRMERCDPEHRDEP